MTVEHQEQTAVQETPVAPKSPVKESLKRAAEEPAQVEQAAEEKKVKVTETETEEVKEEVPEEEVKEASSEEKGKAKKPVPATVEPVDEEESAGESNEEEEGEEGLAETVEDDLAEIDPSNILPDTGRRRTRGIKVDYSKVEAAADIVEEDEDEDEGDFVAEEGSSEQ